MPILDMKALFACLILFVAGNVWSQEEMTPRRFKELVAMAGDTNALRPELASLPFWRAAKCSITMRYQDGKVFRETCTQNAKTIAGKYIVFSMDSQYYKQTTYAIVGYDEKASALRLWGLIGDTLTEATMIFDPETKISASTSRYGDGFMEISAGTCSDTEMTDHAVVYKDGALFMTRDAKTRPIGEVPKVEPGGAANGSQPIRSKTNSTSSAAGSRR
jgi:hypothetical protein